VLQQNPAAQHIAQNSTCARASRASLSKKPIRSDKIPLQRGLSKNTCKSMASVTASGSGLPAQIRPKKNKKAPEQPLSLSQAKVVHILIITHLSFDTRSGHAQTCSPARTKGSHLTSALFPKLRPFHFLDGGIKGEALVSAPPDHLQTQIFTGATHVGHSYLPSYLLF
jgi:hypothetical protein